MDGGPRLLLIPPLDLDSARLRAWLPDLVPAADAILLRESPSARDQWERVQAVVDAPRRPAVVVGGRADLAVAAGVDHVQLRDQGLLTARVRQTWPALRGIGVSRHVDTVGPEPDADWVTFAPVFAPRSKSHGVAAGLEALARAVATCGTRVLALGGVDVTRIPAIRETGAHGIAVSGAVFLDPDPPARARELRAAWDAG